MAFESVEVAPSAYTYPLLIKQLLHTPMATAQDQEIVYRDNCRLTYRDFFQRIGRLANALTRQGVAPGSTVGLYSGGLGCAWAQSIGVGRLLGRLETSSACCTRPLVPLLPPCLLL